MAYRWTMQLRGIIWLNECLKDLVYHEIFQRWSKPTKIRYIVVKWTASIVENSLKMKITRYFMTGIPWDSWNLFYLIVTWDKNLSFLLDALDKQEKWYWHSLKAVCAFDSNSCGEMTLYTEAFLVAFYY